MKIIDSLIFCSVCSGKLKKITSYELLCDSCERKWYSNPLPSNAAIITNQCGEILLVKRAVEPKKGYWDLPGGFIQPGEDFEQSLQREINEELHVEAKVNKIIGVYPDTYLYQSILFPTLCLVALATLPPDADIKVADDVADFAYFLPQNLPKDRIAFPSLEKALADYQEEINE